MASLAKNHIIDLFCLVDEILPRENKNIGRSLILSDTEIATILIWHSLIQRDKTLKEIYENLNTYHTDDFPKLGSYKSFVRRSHQCFEKLIFFLQQILNTEAPFRILDSTFLPVCEWRRKDSHKVAKGIAKMGKNWQGWHYGFKLHASVDQKGNLCGIVFTPADVHDIHGMKYILNEYCKLAVGDTLYGAKVMGRIMYEKYGTVIIAPPHPKQRKKIATKWQHLLLHFRTKIESVFDILKEHMHLVTSFPRSIKGYFLHYVRILIGYQLSRI